MLDSGQHALVQARKVVKQRFVEPLAWWVTRQALESVGWRSEGGRGGGEAQMVWELPDESRMLRTRTGHPFEGKCVTW